MKESSGSDAAPQREKPRRRLLDSLLVLLYVVLLLALGVMLCPQRAATLPTPVPATVISPTNAVEVPEDDGPRERLMSLGFGLLLVSLGVCLYTMYRLGFCCNRSEYNSGRLRSSIPSVNSRLHLTSSMDLPPTYDAIMLSTSREIHPPSYFTIITLHDEKVPPAYHAPAAPTRGYSGAAGAASDRPQEAG